MEGTRNAILDKSYSIWNHLFSQCKSSKVISIHTIIYRIQAALHEYLLAISVVGRSVKEVRNCVPQSKANYYHFVLVVKSCAIAAALYQYHKNQSPM